MENTNVPIIFPTAAKSSFEAAEMNTPTTILNEQETPVRTSLPEISTTIDSNDSLNSTSELKNDTGITFLNISHTNLIFIIIPTIVLLIIGLAIGILIYKRAKKKRQNGMVLQF